MSKNKAVKIEKETKICSYEEAVDLVKKNAKEKFDASIEMVFQLKIDAKNSKQIVRGFSVLPHGHGKEVNIMSLCSPEEEEGLKEAGSKWVGFDSCIALIKKKGFLKKVDVILASPKLMPSIAKKVGRIIGPKGLMPNPKMATVGENLKHLIQQHKRGIVFLKNDKEGYIHTGVGKCSFSNEMLVENMKYIYESVSNYKPIGVKGRYIQSVGMSSTMGKNIYLKVD